MNELALFAGAGGGLLASGLIGHNIVCAVERDEYCIEVLIQRQNERVLPCFPIWDDVCTFDGRPWNGTVDLVSGGFPCQAFSTAARGRNIEGKNLWGEMYRIIREVCPGAVFAENVSEKAVSQALSDLQQIGYKGHFLKISAADMGADHIRQRYWLLAYTNNYGEFLRSKYAKTQGMQELQVGVWESDPGINGVVNGVAYRVDRNRAVGNGQVPIVAAQAWVELCSKIEN